MKRWSEYPHSSRIWIVIGIACLVLAVIDSIGEAFMVPWWQDLVGRFIVAVSHLSIFALVALAIYVIWAAANGRFSALFDKEPPRESLYLGSEDKKIAGVCSGIARYARVDATAVRIITFLLFLVLPIPVLVLYFVMGLAMPQR